MIFNLQHLNNLNYFMRITLSQFIIIIVFSTIAYAGEGVAQGSSERVISITSQTAPLKTILKQISKTSNVEFVYSSSIIDGDQMVTVSVTNEKLGNVLNNILVKHGIQYKIVGDQIVLSKNGSNETVPVTAGNAAVVADVVVTGKVTDEKGEALIGVVVKVKDSQTGAATDVNGVYSVKIPAAVTDPVLVISYIGYTTQEIPVKGRASINIQLQPDSKALNEVVVVGYNTIKKSDVTGAVVSISAEDIRSRPVVNALDAMQGKAAGVDITTSDRPGVLGSILIRGQRSLTASSSPLYVVDGVPLATGGIEAINPNDIQSIDVLKDASATAIYGSRGANGVIIVTTKRGKNGSLSINYAGSVTFNNIVDRTQMMNSAQYIDFRREAFRNQGSYPTVPTRAADSSIFLAAKDPAAWANILKGWQGGTFDGSLVPTTDWTSLVTRTGVMQDHNLSVSGGSEKIRAYTSFGYLNQVGTQIGQDYQRYSGKVSVDITPTKWFAMGASANITQSTQNYGFASSSPSGAGSIYAAAQGMLPYAVPYNPTTGAFIALPGGDIGILNPVNENNYSINRRTILRTLGSVYAEVTFMKGLKYRVNFGPDFYNYQDGQFQTANAINRGGGQTGSTNFAELSRDNKFAYTLDNLLYYDKTIGKHTFGITLLQSSSRNRDEPSDMSAVNLPYDSQLWYQLNSVAALNTFSTGLTETQLSSYMARANYSFNNKYLLTASARWDGASQLAPGHKWDFFPSVALAWRIDQEDFLKNITWIDQLKARLGLGTTGNSAVGAYSTEGKLQTLYYTFGSSVQPGYVSSDASLAVPISFPNPNLSWEHTTQYNLGIDFGFLKGRISGVIDLYVSRTNDLLLLRTIPSVNGYTTSLDNVGISANKGIDITLNTINIRKRDFTWTTTFNFSANRDRIVKLENGYSDDINNSWFIDQRLNVYYDFKKIGIWQNTPADLAEIAKYKANGQTFAPGQIKVADLNGDYKIDANNDRTVVGHANPDWIGGITNSFDYKNFNLSIFIYSRWGFTVKTANETLQGRYAQRQLDYWTPTNPTNAYPAPNYGSAAGDTYVSSMDYQNGSFVAIRNISLGYYLPDRFSKKLNVSKVKVFAQVVNPGLIYSGVSWINPDTGTSTYNRGIILGLNVGF
jgi:TonB-linked SusC/RagA family outer membrane protein